MNNYTLLNHLNQILQPEKFQDYCPNGLQVEGNNHIDQIVTGVSLNDDLIDAAIDTHAQAIIVHHGIFWNKDDYTITGIKHKRIAKLIKNDINLYAYHLPLDNHPDLGNNIQLAGILDLQVSGQTDKQDLLWYGQLAKPLKIEDFTQKIERALGRVPLCFTGEPNTLIHKIAWCTGGADSLFSSAISLGVDAYITGEAAEPTMSIARESGVAFIAAGHYATERYGIMALSQYIQKKLAIETKFIELYNPV